MNSTTPPSPKKEWHLYILECADGTLYTGITTDLNRRLNEHRSGTGAKYTKGRTPLSIVYTHKYKDRSEASKREYEVKLMSKKQKQHLISQVSS